MLRNRSLLILRNLYRPATRYSTTKHYSDAVAMPSPPQPDLPHPAHVEKDSALGRKFGKEIVNYFGSKAHADATGNMN